MVKYRLEEMKRKKLELKEELFIENLKKCPFSPVITSKKQSELYLRQGLVSRAFTPTSKKRGKNYETNNESPSPLKSKKKDISYREYETAKKLLLSQIMGGSNYY
eukprot:GHVR01002345.1.p1 GENE.GHVR01002345.1~~GHVR01002345.1.p1  ORF type:complete len:105 (+),score=13.87 GHVR01002345.1:4816-5130(+)